MRCTLSRHPCPSVRFKLRFSENLNTIMKHLFKQSYLWHLYDGNLISILFFFILIATLEYVNGWGECSITCGGGEQIRTQSCVNSDNTTTAVGQCSGNAQSESRDCNFDPCRRFE